MATITHFNSNDEKYAFGPKSDDICTYDSKKEQKRFEETIRTLLYTTVAFCFLYHYHTEGEIFEMWLLDWSEYSNKAFIGME
jgi:hypothetical protein